MDIAAGRYHSLILIDGGLYSCGDNLHGVLGVSPAEKGSAVVKISRNLLNDESCSISNLQFYKLYKIPKLKQDIIGICSGPFHCLAWNKHG